MNAIDRDALREWARKRIEFYQQFDSDFAKGLIGGINELIEEIQLGAFDIKPRESNGRMKHMTDTAQKIAEIREALEKATQGPWKWIDPGGLEKKKLVGEWEIMNFGIGGMYDQVAGSEPDEDDAHLIANAPEWLRFLLDELERLEQERNMYKASSEVFYERLKKVDEEREKLIECLRFYERLARGREVNDGGRRARTLLAEIGVTV